MDGPRIYNLFPTLVGPVARWSDHLPRIAAMNFDWIYLNPFTPTGGSGSLYAVKEYRSLNPELRGDATEPDDALLRAFTSAAAGHGIRVLVDLVINHTADDAPLVAEHPEWYAHDEDGSVAHPFVVDQDDPEKKTVWGDLAELDYSPRPEREALVAYVGDVAKYYASLGFAGFRCDAAYKIPGDVWKIVIDAVRADRPDAFFLAETLGGPDDEVRQLGPAGFDAFFNSSKWWDFRAPWMLAQYEEFRTIAPSVAFPESHDTARLASEIPEGVDAESEYRFRYLVAATISSGVMMPVGYEYGFRTALDVVGSRPEAWETPQFDLSEFVGAVNARKSEAGALHEEGPMAQIAGTDDGLVALLRTSDAAGHTLVVINPDVAAGAELSTAWLAECGIELRADLSDGLSRESQPPNGSLVVAPRDVRFFDVGYAPAAEGAHADG